MKQPGIGIGLLGLGVIGGQVATVLLEKAKFLEKRAGYPIVLRKIKLLESDLPKARSMKIDPRLITTDENEFFKTADIDIVIELIGGEHPAFEFTQRAIAEKKHLVTANKEVIAKHGVELLALAQLHGVGLHYEASAGGGIPLIAPLQDDLIANNLKGVYAIINGTTNYILTRMAKEGMEFETALRNAQQLGYAEANPRNDIEGIDAGYKLAILASLAFRSQVRPQDVYQEGISRLSSRDFQYARELGFAIKLLAIAKLSDDLIEARVHPVFIPEDSLLAKVDGVFNAILVDGDLVGEVLFYGQGAGPLPTSSAVVADVVAAAHDITHGVGSRARWNLEGGKKVKPMADIETRYYLRMNVADRPGVLAQIAKCLGDHLISISSVIQKLTDSANQSAEIVIMTHPAQERGMQEAIGELKLMPTVKEICNFVRVEASYR